MNWETYKSLTTKQKDEFNFRFKENIPVPFPYMFSSTIILILLIVTLNFSVYLIVTHPDLMIYNIEVVSIYSNTAYIVLGTAWIMVGVIIEYLVRIIIKSKQYVKWKKENNIIETFWYSKWLK